MSELPGLAHMESHLPKKLHPFLRAVIEPRTLATIAKDMGISERVVAYRMRALSDWFGHEEDPSEHLTRLRLVRQAGGVDRCWCDCE